MRKNASRCFKWRFHRCYLVVPWAPYEHVFWSLSVVGKSYAVNKLMIHINLLTPHINPIQTLEEVWMRKVLNRPAMYLVWNEPHHGTELNCRNKREDPEAVVSSRLMRSDRWCTSISILSLKLLKVELVRVFLASNLGQHFLVVVIT